MRRRDLLLVGTIAASFSVRAARGQQRMPVLAYMSAGTPAGREKFVAAFREGLAQDGYVDGKNVAIEFHWGGDDYTRLPDLAIEVARRQVDVIATAQLPSAVAAKAATSTVPIVFLIGDDPVKYGLADSFNHPGGNSTGVSMLVAGLVSKRFELLSELVPDAAVIAVLVNPTNQNAVTELRELEEASRAGKRRLHVFKPSTQAEIDSAIAAVREADDKAVVIGADPYFLNRRAQIVALAARYAVPAIYEWREFVELGGLASYGPSLVDSQRQFGRYAAMILQGKSPADLPIIQPTKFELVINMKTAKALGLTIPQSILVRADEVIQ